MPFCGVTALKDFCSHRFPSQHSLPKSAANSGSHAHNWSVEIGDFFPRHCSSPVLHVHNLLCRAGSSSTVTGIPTALRICRHRHCSNNREQECLCPSGSPWWHTVHTDSAPPLASRRNKGWLQEAGLIKRQCSRNNTQHFQEVNDLGPLTFWKLYPPWSIKLDAFN